MKPEAGFSPQLQMKPAIPNLDGKGGSTWPNHQSKGYRCLDIQFVWFLFLFLEGGYKAEPRAQTRHFSNVDNSGGAGGGGSGKRNPER